MVNKRWRVITLALLTVDRPFIAANYSTKPENKQHRKEHSSNSYVNGHGKKNPRIKFSCNIPHNKCDVWKFSCFPLQFISIHSNCCSFKSGKKWKINSNLNSITFQRFFAILLLPLLPFSIFSIKESAKKRTFEFYILWKRINIDTLRKNKKKSRRFHFISLHSLWFCFMEIYAKIFSQKKKNWKIS